MDNQPNKPCPYCESVGRLPNGRLCPCCNGFKRVGEIGMRRSLLFKALDEKREQQIKEGTYIPPNFDEPCYF